MEIRCIGEPLLRSGVLQLQSVLAPSLSIWRSSWSPPLPDRTTIRCRRNFTSSHRCKADRSPSTPPAKPKKRNNPQDFLSGVFETARGLQPPSPLRSKPTERSDLKPKIDAKFDELFPPEEGSPKPSSSTVSEVAEAFRSYRDKERTGLKPGGISGNMLMPSKDDSSARSRRQAATVLGDDAGQTRRRYKRTIRSRPTVGRTVEVEQLRGVDFGRALEKLAILVAVNRVKNDLQLQKYHERPGLKRKRIKHARWARYFKEGFTATVERVKQMKRQGW